MIYIAIAFVVLCVCNVVLSIKSVDVKITLGKVKGKLVDDETTGAYYYSFTGMPYAEPPVGDLRFKPPVPKRAWSNVFDATKPGRVCPQIETLYSRNEMSEDCLNFNVYTPANNINKLLPVLFNIHGGNFHFHSGNAEPIYGPQLFMRTDVVVVTFNYRLGILGFLSLCNEEVSGNAGVKDVILVLKTVYENIEKFGGDPNKITVVGHGAGAAMAELLMLTNQTFCLFHNVILHGGSVVDSKYLQLNPRKNAMLLGRVLGLNISSDDYFLKKLRNVNAFDLVEANEAIYLMNPFRGFRTERPFKPTVEIECGNAVITRQPLEMIREGLIRDVNMLAGFDNQQGIEVLRQIREEPELIDILNKNFELCVPEDIQYPYGSIERRNLAKRIRDFYFDGENISFVNIQKLIDLVSDTLYTFPFDTLIKLFKEKKCSSVYYYIFAGDTKLNWFKAANNITYPGAGPYDNIGYIFLTTATKPAYKCLDPNAKHKQNSALLNVKYFMNYGSPVPNPNTNCWPEAGKDRYHVVQGDGSIAVYHRPLPERLGFWSSVYKEYFRSRWNTNSYGCRNDDVRSVV